MEFRSNVTNKMVTDSTIIISLDSCDDYPKRCDTCAYFPSPMCRVLLKKDTRALIQRQRERIEALEFLHGHELYKVLGQLEELKQFYGSADISIGLAIAIDTIKKGSVKLP